jgi:integrase
MGEDPQNLRLSCLRCSSGVANRRRVNHEGAGADLDDQDGYGDPTPWSRRGDLDWAATRGHRRGENPARWKGYLENLLPKRSKICKVRHHPALPYQEIRAFMAILRVQEGIAARALEFTILTAARTSEVTGGRWSEFDGEVKIWTVPEGRMKVRRSIGFRSRHQRAPLVGRC